VVADVELTVTESHSTEPSVLAW
jgi:hypothetical protein